MRIIKTCLLSCLYTGALCQVPKGAFDGALTRNGSIQLIDMVFTQVDGKLEAQYSIPEVGYDEVKSDTVYLSNDTIKIKIFYGEFNCFLSKDESEITGISRNWNPKIGIHLKKAMLANHPFRAEKAVFSNGNIELSGTTLLPESAGKIPFVVLIHGSGIQDRNTPYYHSLAFRLARNGIGVLYYDKRGCGSSGGNEETASFKDLASDAASAMQYLKHTYAKLADRIGFLGTSQGGWIAPIAAQQNKNCAFVILNVGPAVTVFKQDIDRVKYSMQEDGMEKSVIDSAVNYTQLYFKYAASGKKADWELLDKNAKLIAAKEWAQYLNIPKDTADFTWWRENNYDPQNALQTIKCPVLSLMGEKDVLVPPAENKEKMERYLSAANIKHKVVVIAGCGHDMLTYQGLNGDNWNWPKVYWKWRAQPQFFIDSIIGFIKNGPDRMLF